MILASMCVLYKFYLHNKIEIVCMVVLVVGSESSRNWVRVVSGLGPIRLGSEKYQGSMENRLIMGKVEIGYFSAKVADI